jgi:hypothetical protein
MGNEGGEARHDPAHVAQTKQRWRRLWHRRTDVPGYREEWRSQQCGACEFWIPFAGELGLDYGACTNPASPHEGTIMYEHDGCDSFSPAEVWAIPNDFPPPTT